MIVLLGTAVYKNPEIRKWNILIIWTVPQGKQWPFCLGKGNINDCMFIRTNMQHKTQFALFHFTFLCLTVLAHCSGRIRQVDWPSTVWWWSRLIPSPSGHLCCCHAEPTLFPGEHQMFSRTRLFLWSTTSQVHQNHWRTTEKWSQVTRAKLQHLVYEPQAQLQWKTANIIKICKHFLLKWKWKFT